MADYNTESNLLNDPELSLRFHREALSVAYSLRQKYFSVFQFMTAEDLVMECWSKILRQNISFQDDKGCKFETFVRMMVRNRCIDMSRSIRRHEGVLSLDEEFMGTNGEAVSLNEFISDKSEDFEGLQDLISVLNTCYDDFSEVDLRKIVQMKIGGYYDREIAKEVGIKAGEVKKILDNLYNVVSNRCKTYRTLADILYGDEDELIRQKDRLTKTLSYVKVDKKSGLKLSDVVTMVIDGATYSQIGKKYKVPERTVIDFLDRYQTMVV